MLAYGCALMKFQKRMLKRTVKGRMHHYHLYLMVFTTKLNKKIEPHEGKNFDSADVTSKDTPTQEILNISLVRNKRSKEPTDSKRS
jgi:hypothetical protein